MLNLKTIGKDKRKRMEYRPLKRTRIDPRKAAKKQLKTLTGREKRLFVSMAPKKFFKRPAKKPSTAQKK